MTARLWLCSGLSALSVLGAAPAAHAGNWVFSYAASGTKAITSPTSMAQISTAWSPNFLGSAVGTGTSAASPTSNPLGGSAAVSIGQAVQDTRTVTLSRAIAHDERVEANGDRHGDTIYSYDAEYQLSEMPSPSSKLEKVWLGFTPKFGEAWQETPVQDEWQNWTQRKGKSHTWSPVGGEAGPIFGPPVVSPDSWSHSWQLMPKGGLSKMMGGEWTGTATGSTERTITYEVTDTDGATAKSNYILHIHDPVKGILSTSEQVSVNVLLRNARGGIVETPNTPYDLPKASMEIQSGTSSSSGFSVGASFPDFAKFIKVLDLIFQYTYTNESSLSATVILPFNVPVGQKSYVMVTHDYRRHHKYLFKYDVGGRQVRMGRGALDIGENPLQLREVPHEAFADEKLNNTLFPFWMAPIPRTQQPPVTSTQPPPFKSTYTS